MSALRLRADVHLHVAYEDTSVFGGALGERADSSIRQVYAPVLELAETYGSAALTDAPKLLAQIVGGELFQAFATADGQGAWSVKPELLYPVPGQTRPHQFTLLRHDANRQVQVGLPPSYWSHAHGLMASLCSLAGLDEMQGDLLPEMRAMLEMLKREEMIAPVVNGASPDALTTADLTFIGHNAAVVRSQTTAILIDPLLFAASAAFPVDYQPLQVHELGSIDAVLLTHSHVDHFDAASLMRLPTRVRVIIPKLERETLLAVDLAYRLRELGFEHVTVLEWWQSTRVGDIDVHALPFFGEQPTDGDMVHPTVRNVGNTYLLRTPTFSVAFMADSGRDGLGDVRDVVARARHELGSVDVMLSGYRGWFMYPVQHLFSSVARYMPFVPPWLWGVRQQLMTTMDGAIDLAERWGARILIPYGDGGAPWHWQIGLGPRLDSEAREISGFDPFPERVRLAAAARTHMPDGTSLSSSVAVLVVRPGESLANVAGDPSIVTVAPHAWPYGAQVVA
jgi:L-ascorbate metabolism protein UlaG (beta-lactamase superfamily)